MTSKFPRPERNTNQIIETAMVMADATAEIVRLNGVDVTSPEHQKTVDELGHVIKSQQEMVGYLVEHTLKLGELLDEAYNMLDRALNIREKKS